MLKILIALRTAGNRGAGMAEYVLLLAIVAALLISAFGGLVGAMVSQLSSTSATIIAN